MSCNYNQAAFYASTNYTHVPLIIDVKKLICLSTTYLYVDSGLCPVVDDVTQRGPGMIGPSHLAFAASRRK